MRCSEFRDLHCAFIDDTLAGVELVRMQRHIAECPECAANDARVRRSLMVAHSLPPIEPSPDFAARLDRRLRDCALEDHQARVSFRTVASVGLMMSAAMLFYMAESLHSAMPATHPPIDIVLPPVIAMATPPSASAALASDSDAASARVIVASVGAGVPVWPVAALVEQPSLTLVSYTQGR